MSQRSPAATNTRLRVYCACGFLMSDVEHKRYLPSPFATLYCPKCGRDNSRSPTPWFRLNYWFWNLWARRKYYGVYGMLQMGLLNAAYLPRELTKRGKPEVEPPAWAIRRADAKFKEYMETTLADAERDAEASLEDARYWREINGKGEYAPIVAKETV